MPTTKLVIVSILPVSRLRALLNDLALLVGGIYETMGVGCFTCYSEADSIKARRRMIRRKIRRDKGQQISEFAAALVLLVFCFFIPLLDLGIMPVRYFLAQEIIAGFTRKLSLCESLSQSFAVMDADPSLETRLIRLGGVQPKNIVLRLIITQTHLPNERIFVTEPKKIPREWLPEGPKNPCEYILELSVDCQISPAMLLRNGGLNIVGLTEAVPFRIGTTSPWENLGRNPITKGYFINE